VKTADNILHYEPKQNFCHYFFFILVMPALWRHHGL